MVSTLQLVTVPSSRDSLDTVGRHEACSVVSRAQKACQGHLNAESLWLHRFGHRLSRAETVFHSHVLEQVIGRKGPGPKQAREAALEGCSSTRSSRTVLRLTSDAQHTSPGLALSKRNVALGFQSQKASLEFIILL